MHLVFLQVVCKANNGLTTMLVAYGTS